MTSAPNGVLNLVERFDSQLEADRSGGYKETPLRRQFIDPLFTQLGWDVANKAGRAEAYKDVIHEDAIKVSGATNTPDYCFRVGGRRIFFVEAKRASVNIATRPSTTPVEYGILRLWNPLRRGGPGPIGLT